MGAERHARLFRNGRSQAVRIPKEFELPGDEVILRMEDGKIVIEPFTKPSLLSILRGLEPIDEDIGDIDDALPRPVEL